MGAQADVFPPGSVAGAPHPTGRVVRCGLTAEPLDGAALLTAVADSAAGGQALFVGTVRNHDHGRGVVALSYEAHPSAGEVLAGVVAQIAARPGLRRVAVEHRLGDLVVGDAAVVIAVAADHRAEAFDACRDLIDEIKAQVPIWKLQHHDDGTTTWVECA